MEKGWVSPGAYLIKGTDSLEDMAGNLSGSELLGACDKFVEGISEVPGDCCGHFHCLRSNSVLMDMDRPLNPLTRRKQGFKEPSFHCNALLLYSPWVFLNYCTYVLNPPPQSKSLFWQMAHRDIWRLVVILGSPTFQCLLEQCIILTVLNVSFSLQTPELITRDSVSYCQACSTMQYLVSNLPSSDSGIHTSLLKSNSHSLPLLFTPEFQPALHQWPDGQGRQSSLFTAPGTSLIVLAGHGIGTSDPSRQ